MALASRERAADELHDERAPRAIAAAVIRRGVIAAPEAPAGNHRLGLRPLDLVLDATHLFGCEKKIKIPLKMVRLADFIGCQSGYISHVLTGLRISAASRQWESHDRLGINWRIAAIDSLAQENDFDLHCSTASMLSKKDAVILRSKMLELIADYAATVKPSADETSCVLNLDFFGLSRA